VAYRDLLPAQYLANLTIAERTAQWAEALARAPRPRGARFGAEVGGHVVGFILVGAASGDPASQTGEVYTINVDPDHWGRGIGRMLLDAGVDHLRASGFAEAMLWVVPGNVRARRFYEAAGWGHDGVDRRQNVLGVDVDETRYRRALGEPPDAALSRG
jgi:ribosomal protein S18 acetylase RimI-like enzyme